MKSKNYFQLITLILVTVFGITLITSCTQAPPKEKYIGLQLYSLRDAMKADPKTTIEKVGEMGYKFVETAGYSDGQFYGMDPMDFKNLCDANGLAFLGSHIGKAIPDSTNWDETMAWWDTCIDAHVVTGAKWIVMPGMNNVAYESLEGLLSYCNYLNAIGEKCNEKGIRFGYHNHAKEFTTIYEEKPLYDWMMENTDPEKVMFQLDLYWIVEGGKLPSEYFDKYPGRFELWHIKDKEELGASGNMDFASIFPEAEKSGMKYSVVEVERYNFDPFVSCKMSIDYLNNADFVKL